MKTNIGVKLVIIFGILFLGVIASASVERQIHKFSPNMSVDRVIYMASIIKLSCYKHSIDCEVFTAILIQESSLRVAAFNDVTADYGVGQINIRTIMRHKFDKRRILTDLKYSIECSAKVFSWFSRTYKDREPATYFARYNVGTGILVGNRLVAYNSYVLKVQRHLLRQRAGYHAHN
jgi:hypothetical protein